MSTLRLEYQSAKPLESCRPGENEIQPGEEVHIGLKPKNPLWPEYLKATVAAPVTSSPQGRLYRLDFDSAALNGGPMPDPCDFMEPRCFSCCDALREEMLNPPPPPGIVVSGGDGRGSNFSEAIHPLWDENNEASFVTSGPPAVSVSLRWERGAAILSGVSGGVITGITRNLLA